MKRFKLTVNGEEIGRFTNFKEIAEAVGCSFQHVYRKNDTNEFTYKKVTYTIIDRLSELE